MVMREHLLHLVAIAKSDVYEHLFAVLSTTMENMDIFLIYSIDSV